MRRYLKYIRMKAPKLPKGNEVFFNSEGNPLNSSSVSEHLEILQRYSGYTGITCTQLRRSVTTMLRADEDGDAR